MTRRDLLAGRLLRSSVNVHTGQSARKTKVSHAAAPPAAREPNAMAARSAANQPRPIAAPMATLLTVSLATAARIADTACARLRLSGVRRNIETVTASTSASPTTIAPETATGAQNVSDTARLGTYIAQRN